MIIPFTDYRLLFSPRWSELSGAVQGMKLESLDIDLDDVGNQRLGSTKGIDGGDAHHVPVCVFVRKPAVNRRQSVFRAIGNGI